MIGYGKNRAVGFVNAKLKPMNKHEIISIFSNGKTSNGNKNNMTYYPQGLIKFEQYVYSRNKKGKENTYWRPSLKTSKDDKRLQEYTNYPTSVLHFKSVNKAIHPTQKPVELLEYLIKTYTKESEVVLDNCMGSGSTGVACVNTHRDFIGIELNKDYFNIAKNRIAEAQKEL